MREDTFKIGKTEITAFRATGNDEAARKVLYRKLHRALEKERAEQNGTAPDPDMVSVINDEAWDYATICAYSRMTGTVGGWKVVKATDSPEGILASFWGWMGLDRSLREPIVTRVIQVNAPMNDPALVPVELLHPEERADPKPEPPEGGKVKT